jgi:CheY-like chemotaxis protein
MATILYIDDDPGVLATRKALLEGKGYRVLIAPNGAAGIEISRKHTVDAVVLDFKPAVMDGSQVADVLAKEQPNVPVAISSDSPDNLPESLKWFADALLQEQAGAEELLLAIQKLITVRSTAKKSASRATVGTNEQLSA